VQQPKYCRSFHWLDAPVAGNRAQEFDRMIAKGAHRFFAKDHAQSHCIMAQPEA
jgi:hypothetical protein